MRMWAQGTGEGRAAAALGQAGIAAIGTGWVWEAAIATQVHRLKVYTSGVLSHPSFSTLTCNSTRKMYQPMMSSSAEAAATAAMVPKLVGRWSVESKGSCRGPLVSWSPLLGALLQPRWLRLKYPPAT